MLQTRAEVSSRSILAIKSTSENILTDSSNKNHSFTKFYTALYTSDSPSPPDPTLNNIEFCHIDKNMTEGLGAPITLSEVQEAISTFQSSKSPGPDGFTAEYYKTFATLLPPALKDVYIEGFALGRLP